MSKNDPVKEYNKAQAKYTNDAIAEMGFGGVADRSEAKKQTQKSGKAMDDLDAKYGIGKSAPKGPGALATIGKAFRNFGSKVSAFFSKTTAPTADVAHTADRNVAASMAEGSENKQADFSRDGSPVLNQARDGANVISQANRQEALSAAKTKTNLQKAGNTIEKGHGRD